MSYCLSIITVSYNAMNTIEETLKSVADVKTEEIQYIVVDGGSTDGTVDILKNYQHILDVFISENDDGIYDAMNKGLSYALGRYCLFIGADDLIIADGFNQALSFLRDSDDSYVYYGNVVSGGHCINRKTNSWKILRENIPHQAVFYPISIYKRHFYSLKYKICADHEYNIRLIGQGMKYKKLEQNISLFGEEGVSSTNIDVCFQRDYLSIVKENSPFLFFIIISMGKNLKRNVMKWIS